MSLAPALRRWSSTSLAAPLIVTAVAWTTVTMLDGGPVRALSALAFLLVAPGVAFANALDPNERLPFLERTALALGLGVAFVPFIGLAINATPAGLGNASTLVAGTLVVLLGTGIAVWRARSATPEPVQRTPKPQMSGGVRVASLALAALVLAGAASFAHVVTAPRATVSFTVFEALDERGGVDAYPTNLSVGETRSVTLVVENRENDVGRYTVNVTVSRLVDGTLRANATQPAGALVLTQGAAGALVVPLSFQASGEFVVTFTLDRDGAPGPYRTLAMPVHVRSDRADRIHGEP